MLRQNPKGQAQIVSKLEGIRTSFPTISQFRRSPKWGAAVRFAEGQIERMPLWRLQTLGGVTVEFLYANKLVDGGIVLKPGVAATLRAFYPIVLHLVRGHWISHIRRIPANNYLVGEHADLEYFLFGAERASLEWARPLLEDLQHGKCFYCQKSVRGDWQVDHFIPWARYPRDLGHNFVLAHAACNQHKSDTLAAAGHVARWLDRNVRHGQLIDRELGHAFLCDSETSRRVAKWSYELDYSSSARLWVTGRQYESIDSSVLALF